MSFCLFASAGSAGRLLCYCRAPRELPCPFFNLLKPCVSVTMWPQLLPPNPCCCWAPSVGSRQVTAVLLHRQIKSASICVDIWLWLRIWIPFSFSPLSSAWRLLCMLAGISPVARWSPVPCACTSLLKPITWCFFLSPVILLYSSLIIIWSSCSSFWKYSPCMRPPSFQCYPLYLGRLTT